MLSIGEFSRICQVSIKTLRYYDKIGLMKPEHIDGFTGYRYYSREQMEKMLLIQKLKRYGFSLEEVKGILMCTEKRVLFLKLLQQKEKLRKQQKEMEIIIGELYTHLRSFERTGDIMGYQKGYEIQLEETSDRAVLASRQKMSVEEFGKYYGKLFERVPQIKATPNGMVGAAYYDKEFREECSDIEVVIGIREREKADKIMEGGLCASTLHKGAYSSLPEAYAAVVSWIGDNDFEMTGVPYEIYVKTQFDGLPPEEWETEIYFPVRKKSVRTK